MEVTFAGRNIRGFALFGPFRKFIPQNISLYVDRESLFPQNFLNLSKKQEEKAQ